jgi:hypothetical protein
MYHASVTWLAREPLDSGALYMMALHPGGARGNQFQSYGLWTASYAGINGSTRKGCNRFNVILTWGVRQSHSWRGKLLSEVAKALIKCALKVWIALSAGLTLWLLGSTSMFLHSFLARKF